VNGLVALAIVGAVRSWYADSLQLMAPQMRLQPMTDVVLLCLVLVVAVSAVNMIVIYRKIVSIWMRK
jgi:hypothetical protein